MTLTDAAGKAVTAPAATPAPAAGNQAWSTTIPAAQVQTLADGVLTAAGTYTLTVGTTTGGTLKVTKDMVAPPAPTATPAAGTYPSTQSVKAITPPGRTRRRRSNSRPSSGTSTCGLWTGST